MVIVGVDPGTRATGFGVIASDGSNHRLVESGVIKAKTSLTFPEKLNSIHRHLEDVLTRCSPDSVVVEDLFYGVNVRSALRLGHVRGVILQVAVSFGVAVQEYAPLEIKQAVVGYGRADKSQVQQMVKVLLSLKELPTPHDASDALAAALCHANRLRYLEKTGASAASGSRDGLNELSSRESKTNERR